MSDMPRYADRLNPDRLSPDEGLPIEEFIQALTSQLDRVQAAMRAKVRAGLPLTFAVRDLSIDLRAHVVLSRGQVRIVPAGPRDSEGASVIRLEVTTITRPMIEENTLHLDPNDEPIEAVLGDDVSDEERRRLEWAGIRTVSQLREAESGQGTAIIEQVAQIPAARLRAALQRASAPRITRVDAQPDGALRIEGRNFLRDQSPTVEVQGTPLAVLKAEDTSLLVERGAIPTRGLLQVHTGKLAASMEFDLEGGAA